MGRRNAVILGCVLMTLGHFCMAFDQSFLLALLLLIVGAGFLRCNLLAQVRSLYREGDPRSTNAMQIYYAVVNVGFFLAPLITGLLGTLYGWHVAFGFAGFGMLIGLVIYVVGARHLPADLPRHAAAQPARRLTQDEWRAIFALWSLLPMLTMYWVINTQEWNVYNLWARDHIDLTVLGWRMPVAWVQSLGGFTAFAMVPPVLAFWRYLAAIGREPDELGKLALGCILMAVFTACDGCATLIFRAPHAVPVLWIVVTNMGESFAYLHVQPVAAALFTRVAPASTRAVMVGIYFLSVFFGGVISGRLGALYEQWSATNFWLLHAAIVGAAGLLLPLVGRPLRRRNAEAGVLQPEPIG